MAQQSKRKTVGKGLDLDDNEESFVKLGTPLPPLTSTKPDQNVFVPVWKQEVTDEQGRRRLHGAFTGGFSAGYFNTVGSKEGWNPSTFKSSRTDKKAQEKGFISQRPEDFMDEEDLAEMAQSKELQTNSVFGSSSTKPTSLNKEVYDPLTGTVGNLESPDPLQQLSRPSAIELAFSELVQPSNVRAGYKIMKQMGWRDGQGIGPRITHERRIMLASKLGIDLKAEMDLDEDPERNKHLFAPIDRPLKAVQPWPGLSGLGYSYSTFSHSEEPLPARSSLPSNSEAKHQGLNIPKGSSFGLGALNDTEDDDQDVYGSSSDQVTSDPRARRLLNLSEVNHRGKSPSVRPIEKAPNRHDNQGSKVFQDNTNLPKGFHLSIAPSTNLPSTSYTPPKVPETWKPCPKQIWEAATKSSEPSGNRTNLGHPSRPINADDRARLLGEQAPPRSVFDFISAKDKARLEDAKQLAQASSRSKVSNQEPDYQDKTVPETSVSIPKLDPVIAKSALSGFIPFSHDPPKQERYKLYLQAQAGILPSGTRFSPKVTNDLTVDVINKELEGFAKSAMMFKPMSAMMASRFTTAASSSAGGELAAPEPGLRQPVFLEEKPEESAPPEEEKEEESKEPVSQIDQAVRIDMFGMLTRSIKEFYPQKLLCKRFNVPSPFPDGPPTDTAPKSSSKNLTEFLASRGFQPASSSNDKTNEDKLGQDNPWLAKANDEETPAKPINQVGLGGDETQGRDILTTSRPPLDLFKAIFGNDTDDEKSVNGEDDLASNPDELVIPDPPVTSAVKEKENVTNLTQQVISLTPVIADPQAVESLNSFRPTFSKKIQQIKEQNLTDTPTTTNENKKGGVKKKKKRVLISFEDDQADEPSDFNLDSKKKKKKKKVVKDDLARIDPGTQDGNVAGKEANVEDEDEWVETVVSIPPPPPPQSAPSVTNNNQSIGGSKPHPKFKRMKASDLMD